MINSINLLGQWVGQFTYGPEYGEEMQGKKVQFRIFINHFTHGQFKGSSVDTDGFGANFDTAIINGFLMDDFISFTKDYPDYFIIDDIGQKVKDRSNIKPRLSYKGYFDFRLGLFSGQWELWANEELARDGSIIDIFTGTWEMMKDV